MSQCGPCLSCCPGCAFIGRQSPSCRHYTLARPSGRGGPDVRCAPSPWVCCHPLSRRHWGVPSRRDCAGRWGPRWASGPTCWASWRRRSPISSPARRSRPGPGVLGSDSKMSGAFGPIWSPAPRLPYARAGGTKCCHLDPPGISLRASRQPGMPPVRASVASWPRMHEESNSLPSSGVPREVTRTLSVSVGVFPLPSVRIVCWRPSGRTPTPGLPLFCFSGVCEGQMTSAAPSGRRGHRWRTNCPAASG